MAAVAVADLVVVVLDVVEEAAGVEVGDDPLAALEAVEARVGGAGELVHRAVAVHDVDLLEAVALADEEVVRVVGGRDLHDARAELALDVVVREDGDLAPGEREDDGLAVEVQVALVLGVHRDGRVAREGLGTGRGDHDVVLVGLALHAEGGADDGVAHVPEVAVVGLVLDLVVREGGAAARAPVHDVVAAVDEVLLVHLGEDLGDGAGEALVHREALVRPVAGAAEGAKLADDRAAVLLLPLPDALDEGLAAEVLAALALLAERLLDDVLRGDAGVVGAGDPERVVAAHAVPADEDVLDRVVEGVAHVEDARHVGRRDDDRVGLALAGRLERAGVLPDRVPLGLDGLGIVVLVHVREGPARRRPFRPRARSPVGCCSKGSERLLRITSAPAAPRRGPERSARGETAR